MSLALDGQRKIPKRSQAEPSGRWGDNQETKDKRMVLGGKSLVCRMVVRAETSRDQL